MTLLNTVNVGGTDYRYLTVIAIGSCDTPAGTEIKQVSFTDDFQLVAGVSVAIRFTYANTYGDGSTTYPKLQVNGTNYPIKTSTGSYAASGAWVNTQTVTLMFDGTGFVIANDAVYNNMVIKKDVTITTPSTIENDIKALGNELLSLVSSGTQTFSGLFFRTGVTFGSYTLTIRNASSCINGYVVIDNEQSTAGMYFVTRVNNDWVIKKLTVGTLIHTETPVTYTVPTNDSYVLEIPVQAGKYYTGHLFFLNLPAVNVVCGYNDFSGLVLDNKESGSATGVTLNFATVMRSTGLRAIITNYTGSPVTLNGLTIIFEAMLID